MLRFEQLKITNFGPFRGEQTMDFHNGVTVIWGENGRGKTTLLNVFRYALFGYVKNRHGESKDYQKLCNIEAIEAGEYGFSIILKMSNDNDRYILTRDVHLRAGVFRPHNNQDYIEDCFLKKNGNILSPQEREHELALIIPEDIARFFLFDGELLQEYESLLSDTSAEGDLIKKSIEKILGMPVLTNSVSDIRGMIVEYNTAKNKAAQNDKNTQELAKAIETLDEQIKSHTEEKQRLEDQLAAEHGNCESIRQELSATDKLRALLVDEKREKEACSSLDNEIASLHADIQDRMKTAWLLLAHPIIEQQINGISGAIKEYDQRHWVAQTSVSVVEHIEAAIRDHKCAICDQPVSDMLIHALEAKVNALKQNVPLLSDLEREELATLRQRLERLQSVKLQNDAMLVVHQLGELNKLSVKKSDAEQRLRDVQKQLATFGNYNPDIADLTIKYSKSQERINVLKTGIEREAKMIAEAQDRRKKLDDKVSASSKDKDVIAATNRLALCQQLLDLFEEGIDRYRMRLKESVGSDASELFAHMSADEDYEHLQINDNYGLQIIHKIGIPVPNRSAGFEHVVALSLIGALHKNAPLQGPVIMDSPFGRLGPKHKEKVTHTLPLLANQVILLVYEGEIDPEQTRTLLGGNLIREYHLDRITSFHTQIC